MGGSILSDESIKDDLQKQIASQIAEGLEHYKVYLQVDLPKTTGWVMREKELVTALERMESETHCNQRCPNCNNTGKPCDSCGEFHLKLVMCPPHEVRSSQHHSCPTCGKFFWQCSFCKAVINDPILVRRHICYLETDKNCGVTETRKY